MEIITAETRLEARTAGLTVANEGHRAVLLELVRRQIVELGALQAALGTWDPSQQSAIHAGEAIETLAELYNRIMLAPALRSAADALVH